MATLAQSRKIPIRAISFIAVEVMDGKDFSVAGSPVGDSATLAFPAIFALYAFGDLFPIVRILIHTKFNTL
jgi:hypothetical protein